ncbi:metallophosphoesterase [Candidatus Woesearchaeota archaeon]|nr:metallophosphoesterase [Candidatus Woesearchaeota archaeon]
MKQLKTVTAEPTIAYITDLHGNREATRHAATYLKENPVHIIILGGDIPDFTPSTLSYQLRMFLKLNKPVIIFPGSHENSENYTKALKEFSKNTNLIDGVKERHIVLNNFNLLIVPGSDTVSSGNRSFNGGTYKLTKTKSPTTTAKLTKYLKEHKIAKKATPIAISNTTKHYDKKPAIIFAHIPLLCNTPKGIDIARFGTFKHAFTIKPADRRKKIFNKEFNPEYNPNILVNYEQAKLLKEYHYPVIIKKENVGSPTLRKFALKKNIRAYVCGHIHEAGPKAINKEEKTVRQNNWTKQVFINSGPGSEGNMTILTLNKAGEVKYNFVKF